MIEWGLFLVGLLHVGAFVHLTIIFRSVENHRNTTVNHLPFYSIVIPVRNEADNIAHLLNDLDELQYAGKFEVIVVDDASEDTTREIVSSFSAKFPLRSFQLPREKKGKKAAITMGVSHAKGDWIITTDGDCRVQAGWLTSFAENMDDNTLMMVGPVKMNYKKLFGALQSFDFSILIGYAASLVRMGVPSMSNGANLAYRKEIFHQVGGYNGNDHVPSGDDEFLLLKVYRRFKKGIQFNSDKRAVVSTEPKASFHELLNQRKRWLSKWTLHRNAKIIFSVLIILLDNLLMIGALVAILSGAIHPLWLTLFLMRILAKGFFSATVNQKIGGNTSWLAVVIYEFIYPFYVVLLSIASIFGYYTWKGRRYA